MLTPARPRKAPSSSLARKYTLFTVMLLGWVAFVFLAYDFRRDNVSLTKAALFFFVIVLVGGAIARFTHHTLARPLSMLQSALIAVCEGRLEPIPVMQTCDEVEFLGESFNSMIAALADSRKQVEEHSALLETRIRQRTEALQEATQKALAASRAKSEFLANVSHELRTPLNGVMGLMEIVLDDDLAADQRVHLETAQGCARTLLALLNDILDLSKIEAGRLELEKIPFDLRTTAQEAIQSLAPKANEKGITLGRHFDPHLPLQVVGDPLRLRQVMFNLLGNAVKFTDHGSVDLRVEVRRTLGVGSPEVVIEVRDTGAGIPKEKLPVIFDEFTQADGSISRKYGGTGLGLAITRRLVEMHGGQIAVESEVGRGSTFRVTMPCNIVEQPVAVSPLWNSPTPSRPEVARGSARILVVEDNLVNQKIVMTMLGKNGYQVSLADNGGQALTALDTADFDLVLMDVQMPVMDGIEATRRIRGEERWKHLPIIAMTAHAMQGDRERCLAAGMNGYLSKPVSAAHLAGLLGSLLRPGVPDGKAPEEPLAGQLPPPIDRDLVRRLMDIDNDAGLMRGMTLLFLQLAPERLGKLQTAATRQDGLALRTEAHGLGKSAERIAAVAIARCAAQIEASASADDFESARNSLFNLEQEITRLDRHVRLDQEGEAEPAPWAETNS